MDNLFYEIYLTGGKLIIYFYINILRWRYFKNKVHQKFIFFYYWGVKTNYKYIEALSDIITTAGDKAVVVCGKLAKCLAWYVSFYSQ